MRTMLRGDVCEDIVHGLLLAHLGDSQSAFYQSRFPRDVLSNILHYYTPPPPLALGDNSNFFQPPSYLLPRALSRSYYQICMDMCEPIDSHAQWFKISYLDYCRFPSECDNVEYDLVASARRVLCFLLEVRDECERTCHFAAYSDDQLATLFDDYVLFLLLLKAKTTEAMKRHKSPFYIDPMRPPVIPPTRALQAVWFSHMLQSGPYAEFITCLLREGFKQHISSHPQDYIDLTYNHFCLVLESDRALLEKKSQQLWEETYTPDLRAKAKERRAFIELKAALLKHYTPAMFLADQDWIVEFVKFTRGTDVFSEEFLKKAHIGYQRMMYLKWQNAYDSNSFLLVRGSNIIEQEKASSTDLEAMHFAPCPAVDLMWHTHLLKPNFYYQDMNYLLGFAPKHKLLQLEDRNLHFMNDREFKEERLWQKVFGESLFDYAIAKDSGRALLGTETEDSLL